MCTIFQLSRSKTQQASQHRCRQDRSSSTSADWQSRYWHSASAVSARQRTLTAPVAPCWPTRLPLRLYHARRHLVPPS
ncbi:uncharacterized protein B0H18DRAFT_981435 [Fomitopsis serialis]|uniref:uncharacterized protein n=1 Tax=Fomitopsis serialis TaxID=139415 RepID=UPI002007A402|nr:uncharacterized protein B0H18DRAFT_981435 [Neoantrodia serialis]KAH9934367.1 hypothetical protein B0H18DRAFT_981435 [Neoantrodia serialis]